MASAVTGGRRRSFASSGALLTVAFILGSIIWLGVSGCGGTAEPDKTSMKGWELYSWQEGEDWRFSLLEGTNRTKTVDEVQAPEGRLDGIDALTSVLEGLAVGEWVTWWCPSWAEGAVAFPPSELVEQVRQICEQQGLELKIVTEGP